jgi:hypothetical protein
MNIGFDFDGTLAVWPRGTRVNYATIGFQFKAGRAWQGVVGFKSNHMEILGKNRQVWA